MTSALLSLAWHFVALFSIAAPLSAGTPFFENIEPMWPLGALSRNGDVVLGIGGSTGVIRYARNTGPVELPLLPNANEGEPLAISDDGSRAVGYCSNSFREEACLWSESTVQSLGSAGDATTKAVSISADGSVVFGTAWYPGFVSGVPGDPAYLIKVFRWTEAGGMHVFDLPERFALNINYIGATRDGSAVYASGRTRPAEMNPPAGENFTIPAVARWDATGAVALIAPPEGYAISWGMHVSGDGTLYLPVVPSPAGARWWRWRPTGAEFLPPLIHHGRETFPDLVASSDDGETLIFSVSNDCYRFHDGSYSYLGAFEVTRASADCAVVVGLRDHLGLAQPVIWTQASGLLPLLPRLRDELGSAAPMGGNWSDYFRTPLLLAASGDRITVAGRPLSRSSASAALLDISAPSLAGPSRYAGDLLDGKVHAVFREQFNGSFNSSVYQSTLAITVPFGKAEADTFDAATAVEVALGNVLIRAQLGDDPNYAPGATSARLLSGNSSLNLSWSAGRLTLQLTCSQGPEAGPGTRDQHFFLNDMAGIDNRVISGVSPLSLRVGDRTGTRFLRIAGSVNKRAVTQGEATSVTSRLLLKGGFDQTPPVLTVSLPKNGTAVQTRFIAFNPVVNEPGSAISYRLNGGAWITTAPNPLPRYVTLTPGENLLEIKAVDRSGNESVILARRLIYQPRAGRYCGILQVGTSPRGFFSILLSEAGGFTGTVVFDGVKFPIRQSLDDGGVASFSVLRPNGDPAAVELALAASPERNDLGCRVEVPQAVGPAVVAHGSAGRAGWNSHFSATDLLGADSFGALLQPDIENVTAPTGSGVVELIPNQQTGHVTGRGKLADGTPIAFSAPISDSLQLPIHAVQAGKRLLAGTLQFDPTQAESDVTGTLRWQRLPGTAGPFVAGWDTLLDVIGSRGFAPGLPPTYYNGNLPLFPYRSENGYQLPTARLRFAAPGIPEPLLLPIYCDHVVPLGPALHPSTSRPLLQAVLKQDPRYNVIFGSFVSENDGRRIHFAATKIPKANLFGGYFLTLAGAGSVTIEANP